jgi:hypothetical protein
MATTEASPTAPAPDGEAQGRRRGRQRSAETEQAILQVTQHFFIGVDDCDFVRFFARQVVRRRASDLPGAEYHDLHGGGIVAA